MKGEFIKNIYLDNYEYKKIVDFVETLKNINKELETKTIKTTYICIDNEELTIFDPEIIEKILKPIANI